MGRIKVDKLGKWRFYACGSEFNVTASSKWVGAHMQLRHYKESNHSGSKWKVAGTGKLVTASIIQYL